MSFPNRIIALEIRASKFGFAVLEGPGKLLDWGVRSFAERGEDLEPAVADRISTLLTFYAPVTVVARDRQHHEAIQQKRILTIFATAKQATRKNSARFRILSAAHVRKRFAPDGRITKHEVARILTERFEELSFRLPSRRKAYQSEAPAMLIFDALATGVAFLDRGGY
jgi:hypothetical protein